MDNTDIQKQLHFRCLTSQTQGNTKLNFASSQKLTIFALVNQQYGLPRESAFCLFRVVNFDTHKNERWNREDECSHKLYSYSRHTLWGNSQTLFNLSGSRSPTTQK